MGLIRDAIDSVTGVLADQYKTAINCGDMGNHILMVKKTKANGIIRDGSRIIVNPGQLAVLVDNGKVIDATAEQGVFEFRTDASPSFFAGSFGAVFKEMWTRFTFGAGVFQDQAIYFINAKEIIDNGFGTPAPVMYRDWEHCMADARRPGSAVPMRVALRCAGNYTFQIDRPDLFLQRIGGTATIYQKEELCQQMRMEIIASFQSVLGSLCSEQNKVYPFDLPAQSPFIKQIMDSQEFDTPIRNRGLRLVGFNVVKVDLDEESKNKIDAYELSGDAMAQQAKLTDAAVLAAGNSAGAGVGFMGLHMMNSSMGSMFPQSMPQSSMVQAAANTQNQMAAPGAAAVGAAVAIAPAGQPLPVQIGVAVGCPCTQCGAAVTGNFCAVCGTPAPLPSPPETPVAQFCSNCGAKANGRFCAVCGTPL